LKKVQMFDDPAAGRLAIWRASGPGADRFAVPEVIEHIGLGEFLWLASDSEDGASWMLDASPVTVLELLDHVPGTVAEWVVDRTFALLAPVLTRVVALEAGDDGELPLSAAEALSEEFERDPKVAGLGVLLDEFNRLAAAAGAFSERITEIPVPASARDAADAGRPQAAA
jgi:hypothetical protein